MWHGFNDPGPSPLSTIAYFEAVNDKVSAAKDAVRLFLAPGVLHCRGGAGPDQIRRADRAWSNWVEKGDAAGVDAGDEGELLRCRGRCVRIRSEANYKGSGDTNDPANFACAAP